jgi:hypothetical protein
VDTPNTALRDALQAAKYAELACRAQTDEARQLVQNVFEPVVGRLQGSRGPYADTKKKMLRVVEGFLGDLLRAAGHRTGEGWVYRPLSRSHFSKQEVSYRAFKPVLKPLEELGLIERKAHFRPLVEFDPGKPVAYRSYTSRFRAAPKLLAFAAEHGVAVEQAKDHFGVIGGPKDLLVLRATSTWDGGEKIRGKRMPITGTEETERLEAEVRELNDFLNQFELGGGKHRGYFRLFNCGDHSDFAWNMGGRLYSYSNNEDSYQQLKPRERLRMTINGEVVAEVDIKASFLTIYLAGSARSCPQAIPICSKVSLRTRGRS